MAVVVGGLYAAGLYLMLRRGIIKLLIGLALLSNGANLLIFTASGMTRGRPPLVPEGAVQPEAPFADPLPQALILTAIVISFGVLAFAIALVHRVYQTLRVDDLDQIGASEETEEGELE
jgi:multicomponent Na+:H+ antiporter subunit C